jgi:hypothetical protein
MTTEAMHWVSIPVPQVLAPAVFEFLAAEMRRPASSTQGAEVEPEAAGDAWTPEEVTLAIRESPPGMKALLEAMAEEPGTWFDSATLAKAIRERGVRFGGPDKPDANWQTVAGTLGAFGHRVLSRYGKKTWFTEARKDPQDRWKHMMPARWAELVLKVLRES